MKLQTDGKRPRTLYTYGKDIEQILAFFGAEKLISKITLPLVGKFYRSPELLNGPNGKPRASRTVLKTVRVFRQMMHWAHAQGWVHTLPIPKGLPKVCELAETSMEQALDLPDSWGVEGKGHV